MKELKKSTKFKEKEIKEMYWQFLEEYPDGYISKEEFHKATEGAYPDGDGRQLVEIVFNNFDQNQDGKIDFVELTKTLDISQNGSDDDRLRFVFGVFDHDKDGFIRKDEMERFLLALMLATGEAHKDLRKNSKFVSTVKKKKKGKKGSDAVPEDEQLSPEEAELAAKAATEEIFQEVDENEDAKISFEEFKEMTMKHEILKRFSPRT